MRKLRLMIGGILLLAVIVAQAQIKQLTGKVTDATGAPIPGATIKIKGSKAGTSAGADGAFQLSVPANAILVISGVGFEAKEIKPGTLTVVNISLNQDAKSLSEVVVTGVGAATSKKKLAFAVETVTAEQLPPGNTASVDQALVGKVAGAQISSISGVPGAPVNILLRGVNSISAGTTPMIMVDGVQLGASSLNSLDLSQVERVEIVQGAASSAIYGAQGANGVIQIFTKKGKAGQLDINFSSSVASNTLLNIGGVHKAYKNGFAVDANNTVLDASGNPVVFDSVNSVFTNSPLFNVLDPTNTMSHPYGQNLKYYDHLKEFLVSATQLNNSVSVSGGKEKLDFNFYASNNQANSNFKNQGYNNRSNFGANVGFEVFKGFKIRSTTQLVYTRNTVYGGSSNSNQSLFYGLLNSKPFVNYDQKDADGNYSIYNGNAVGVNGSNPNYKTQYSKTLNNTVDVIQTIDASYRINKYVDLDAKYGMNFETGDQRYTIYNQSLNKNALYTNHYLSNWAPDQGGEVDYTTFKTTFQNFLANANFHFDLDRDFHLKVPITSQTLVGWDYRNNNYQAYSAYATDVPLFSPINATEGTNFKTTQDYVQPFITYGFVVSEKLDWGTIGGIGGGFRTDYSSAFGAGHTPFTFPNANGYIRPSSLNFWQNGGLGKIFPELKIRASYGEAGIQPGAFARYVVLGTQVLGSADGLYYPSGQPNPNLQVIVSKEYEVGADLNFKLAQNGQWFRNGFFSPTYWSRKTKGDIVGTDVAPSTGVGTVLNNAFGLTSSGFQFKIGFDVLSSKNLTWNFTTLFGHQTSIISSIEGGQPIVQISYAGSTNYILAQGEKVGQLYGYLGLHSVGQIDPTTKQPFIDKASQANYSVASNGWVVNTASKQPYFSNNQYSFGDPNPKFNMSFINEFSYKSIVTLNFQWDWVSGQHLYNQTKEWMFRDAINGDYDKPITIGGQTGAWTAIYRGVYAVQQRDGTKNYFYEDASFLRLRHVAVSIDVAKLANLKAVKRLQLVLSGRNLITVTKYTGFDPEISSGGNNSAWDRGTDHSTIPNYKSYQVGLNLGF